MAYHCQKGGLMDANLKAVLLEIVQDLADLRANQDVLSRLGNHPTKTLADARDAKSLAKQEHDKTYAKLLQKINAL
jgi:hypothetical protein